jgi:MFS family permease
MPAMKFSRPPVRVLIVLVLTAMAALLYLERVCVSVAEGYIREDLRIGTMQMDAAFGAFFIAYALGQVPGGYLAQRYGPRLMLTFSMVGWSVFGIFIALAQDFPTLFAARFLLGLSQAAAYPTAALLLTRWVPDRHRGLANSIVTFGGRFGGAAATGLTGFLIIAFVPLSTPATVTADDFDLTRAGYLDHLSLDNGQPKNRTVETLNALIQGGSFAETFPPTKELPLTYDARRILAKPPAERTSAESERLTRLVLESATGKVIRPLHLPGWRPTLLSYGLLGVVVGVVVWLVVRDSPREHPWVSAAEAKLIDDGIAPKPPIRSFAVPWRALVTSRNQWLYCGMSFFSNYGWVFLITLLPRFLENRYQVPLDQRSLMTTVPLFLAAFGMLAGGFTTDVLTRRYGRWWGRALPMGGMKLPCAALMAVSPWLPEAWMFVGALALVAVCQDFGIPAVWAFAQDTGGEQVGPVLGWGNMWGNFGAGVAPFIMGVVAAQAGWTYALLSGASAFAVSAVCGLMANAALPLHEKVVESVE